MAPTTMRWKGFALIMAAILIVFLSLHITMKGNIHRKADKENELRIALARLEEENNELLRQLKIVGTEEYIVQSAIRNYSYVNKDDIRFEFSNPEALDQYSEAELRILIDEMSD